MWAVCQLINHTECNSTTKWWDPWKNASTASNHDYFGYLCWISEGEKITQPVTPVFRCEKWTPSWVNPTNWKDMKLEFKWNHRGYPRIFDVGNQASKSIETSIYPNWKIISHKFDLFLTSSYLSIFAKLLRDPQGKKESWNVFRLFSPCFCCPCPCVVKETNPWAPGQNDEKSPARCTSKGDKTWRFGPPKRVFWGWKVIGFLRGVGDSPNLP